MEIDEETANIINEALNFSSLNRSFHSNSSGPLPIPSVFNNNTTPSVTTSPIKNINSNISFDKQMDEYTENKKNISSKKIKHNHHHHSKSGRHHNRSVDHVGAGDGTWTVIANFPIVSVLFQQGINEQQAVCNAISTKALLFQSSVNRESLDRLEKFMVLYKDISISQAIGGKGQDIQVELKNWDDALDSLRRSIYSQLKINVHIILHASNLCRQLSGTHAICCKSGKDRTSMLVSLEEARLLCDHLRVIGGRKACTDMRRFGVRRDNVEMNTGQRKYAFNDVQRIFLPKCFQPPQGTYSGNAVT
jgi:inositol polyphosphate-4-phosphatase